jgi:hypothetical protein
MKWQEFAWSKVRVEKKSFRSVKQKNAKKRRRRREALTKRLYGKLASLVYAVGAWSPVLHCSLCVAAVIAIEVVGTNQQQLSSKLANVELSRDILQQAQNAPNVVLLIHDSLSGSAMMNTNEVSAPSFLSSVFDLFIRLTWSLVGKKRNTFLSFLA